MFRTVGVYIFPLLLSIPLARIFNCNEGRARMYMRKYMVASCRMVSSPPSQRGRGPLMAQPAATSSRLNIIDMVTDWRRTSRAATASFAPRRCDTCTKNPVAQAYMSPAKSHVVVDTSPIDAEASAPRLPTIEASMNCIRMEDSCEMTAGILNCTVSLNCCIKVIGRPSCTSLRRLFCLLPNTPIRTITGHYPSVME